MHNNNIPKIYIPHILHFPGMLLITKKQNKNKNKNSKQQFIM